MCSSDLDVANKDKPLVWFNRQPSNSSTGELDTTALNIAVTPIDYSKEAEIPAKLQDIEGIMSCDSVAGSPSYMLTVRAASPSKLEDLLNVIHQTVPVSTETTIVLQRYFSK